MSDCNSKCDHLWRFVRDWYGDKSVYNGTADCSYWRCRKCGATSQDDPEYGTIDDREGDEL